MEEKGWIPEERKQCLKSSLGGVESWVDQSYTEMLFDSTVGGVRVLVVDTAWALWMLDRVSNFNWDTLKIKWLQNLQVSLFS